MEPSQDWFLCENVFPGKLAIIKSIKLWQENVQFLGRLVAEASVRCVQMSRIYPSIRPLLYESCVSDLQKAIKNMCSTFRPKTF